MRFIMQNHAENLGGKGIDVKNFFLLFALCVLWPQALLATDTAVAKKRLARLVENQDAVLLTDPEGNTVFSANADKKLIPASILKIFTSLTALYWLGPKYRFPTEFYLDSDFNLTVKGYGDPIFTSEDLVDLSHKLGTHYRYFNRIILDPSYFNIPVSIDGISVSSNPYDAPNGALCVNFNTVYFTTKNSKPVSAEVQTPLLPLALRHIRKSGLKKGRVTFSHKHSEITRYCGHLLAYFLEREHITIDGGVQIGTVDPAKDRLALVYASRFSLEQIISKLLTYSNNYIANQLLLSAGAKAYGPPATLEKGVRAARVFAKQVLGINDLQVSEGSGISRKNRIAASTMQQILEKFEPHRRLMTQSGNEFFKTGSLNGIKSRAGYIEDKTGGVYHFVVMINTPNKSTNKIVKAIKAVVAEKQ